ncbi:phospholipase D-like domain-containing protein [Pseudorhodobacter sp. MZDSW-24AT]|uniref:phospholipase D-like domain-containing protein n=1 Tax=Pseudorhodobacter sp. MZDSW-24AT TaxID=2052957 RepID=UPI000C1F38C8|nr:phospholipase D-like domain-containing protein [Pseudorhodobacter sp. MZDSW-24AT]PJF11072.1 phospholipase [Pseudorhodobacter sp. MZDSW-24AT]
MNADTLPDAMPKVFITAAEAYPALENAFLTAETEIIASFLVFDPETRLRSAQAQNVGPRWFDLIVDCLRRGVNITLKLSDFDPIARAAMHRGTWRSIRLLQAAAEVAGPGAGKLKATVARHPAETGSLPRFLLSPVIMKRVWRLCQWLNKQPADLRAAALREMPGAAELIVVRPNGTVRPRLWPVPRLFPGTHHQKIAVFDRRLLYVGGLDLNERRYDDQDHERPADQTWHDVQIIVEGKVAEDAVRHLESFEAVTAGDMPPVERGDLLVTLSTQRRRPLVRFGPKPVVQSIFDAHCAAISKAKGLIYLETQYFRDGALTRALCAAAAARPDLHLLLMLPGAPEELAFEGRTGLDSQVGEWHQARCLRRLQRSFGARLFIGSAAQQRRGRPDKTVGRDHLKNAPLIYIHAKVSVFDHVAIISSANLNGRSMRWDTEAGVSLTDLNVVDDIRHRCMAHWLPEKADQRYFAPETAVAAWRGLALSNAARPPESRQGFVLPYDVRIAEKFGTPLPFLPPEMV